MSNFEFMNNEKFLVHPGCRRLYEYAMAAEDSYWFDHEKCAMKVRFILEQACVLGSELKNASYPQKISMLGDFWCKENYFEFLRAFEGNISNYIKEANLISRSYMHTGLLQASVPREDLYPQMLEYVYKILLWLYKSLGYETRCIYNDYSEDKIPKGQKKQTNAQEEERDIYYSPEEVLKNFKKYFPNCQTESLCTVEQQKDTYVIKDLSGRIVSEFVRKEDYEVSEEEKIQMKRRLESISGEYNTVKEQFIKHQKEKEEQIHAYAVQIVAMQNENSDLTRAQEQQLENWKQDVKRLKLEMGSEVEAYKAKIAHLGAQYDELYDKYVELIPAEEQRQQLHQQVLGLLEERRNLESAYREKENILLGEIDGLKTSIYTMKRELVNANASTEESRQVIVSLENALQEKEQALNLFQKEADMYFQNLQNETAAMIKSYKDKAANLEIILTNVMMENAEYKEKMQMNQIAKETTALLQIVKDNVGELAKGFAVYKQDANEQKLRMLLLKVKAQYDEQIYNLERELREKERALEKERWEKERIMQEMWRAQQTQNKTQTESVKQTQNEKKTKKYIWTALLVSVVVLLGVLGKVLITPQEEEKLQQTVHQNGTSGTHLPVSDAGGNNNTEIENSSQMDDLEETEISEVVEETENQETEASEVQEETEVSETIEETEIKESEETESVQIQPENTNQDKLDQLLSDREWANSRPKDLVEIPNIHAGLKAFAETEYYVRFFEEFYAKLEYLGEADIYSVASRDAKIYTIAEYDWMTFCWNSSRNNPGVLIMYVEPSVVSADLNRNSTRTQVVEMLGEPTNIYYDIGWSDFNFQEIEELDIMYEWEYTKTDYSLELRFVFDEERILDYCQVIFDVY